MTDAIVVGGGITGISIAYALCKRGKKTILLEALKNIGSEGSGNPAGVAYPYLTKYPTPDSLYSLRSFEYLNQVWQEANSSIIGKKGVIFAFSEKENERYTESLRSHALPISLVELRDSFLWSSSRQKKNTHLWFPDGLTYSPASMLSYLVQKSGENLILNTETKALSLNKKSNGCFAIGIPEKTLETPLLFLAHGRGALADSFVSWLPMTKVRGQILQLKDFPSSFLDSHALLFGGYLTANLGGGPMLGASYREFVDTLEPSFEETNELFQKAESFLPDETDLWNSYKNGERAFTSRVQFRMQLQDRRPVLGGHPLTLQDSKPEPGLYCALGFGSRGLNLALYSGELVVKEALGESLREEEQMFLKDFSPLRFHFRKEKTSTLGTQRMPSPQAGQKGNP